MFLNSDIATIVGLSRHDHQNTINESVDSAGFELRHFLGLLKRGNTQCLEMINNDIWIEKTPQFDLIQSQKERLFDSETIYKCFRGYSFSERNLIFGRNHLGRIGEKRKEAIKTYGYSFKNCSHCYRLLRTGIIFFRDNYFPVNIVEKDKEYSELIKDIKFHPERYDPKVLEVQLIELEKELDDVYQNRKINYKYDFEFANLLCYQLYMPILKQYE